MELQKVMLVEDDEDIRTVARMALELVGGFTVEVCGSGAQALERVAGFGPDIILLDVMMPGMDGPETLRRLRDDPAGASVPVVFMTAKAMPSELEELLALGAVDVISKPFDPMTLGRRVRDIRERCQR